MLRTRFDRIPAKNRPHYLPTERLTILELKAARCWNAAQTARRLLLAPATILQWLQRLDRDGEDALIKIPVPVNRFPDMVEHLVQSLRAQLPTMGKQRIADVLARAGLHLSVTTVARMLKRMPKTPPKRPERGKHRRAEAPKSCATEGEKPARTVTAKHPHHVWNVDFTTVSTALGYWVPWLPFSLPTVWPFSWHLLVVVDHFSRKILGFKLFRKEATTDELCAFLTETAKRCGAKPKYIVSDQGTQFRDQYRAWCKTNGITPRFGAVGKHGSIAVTERTIRSVKTECTRMLLVPYGLAAMSCELDAYLHWFNEFRPHQGLGGKTPNEVFEGKVSARDGPQWETRKRFPLASLRRGSSGKQPVKLTGLFSLSKIKATRDGVAEGVARLVLNFCFVLVVFVVRRATSE